MQKLSRFVNDTAFFQPKTMNQVLSGLKSSTEEQKYQQIIEILSIDPFGKVSMKIKDSYDLFRVHNCPPNIPQTQSLLHFQWQINNPNSLETTN